VKDGENQGETDPAEEWINTQLMTGGGRSRTVEKMLSVLRSVTSMRDMRRVLLMAP
jgi:hypothetical protein